MSYVTPEQVRGDWRDAPLDDTRLQQMIDAAHVQVVAYAPALEVGAVVPANYAEAELLQTKAIGQANERDGDVLGFGDGFAVRVRPLGADVKALLRPRRGAPRVR